MAKSDPTAGLDRYLEDRCGVNDKLLVDCSICEEPECVDQYGYCYNIHDYHQWEIEE